MLLFIDVGRTKHFFIVYTHSPIVYRTDLTSYQLIVIVIFRYCDRKVH